jgi:hypothetical protein
LERNPARRTANTSTLAQQLNNPNLLSIPLVSRRQAMWTGATVAATAALSASGWWLTRPKPEAKIAPDLVIDVPGAVALATGTSWKASSQPIGALVWADNTGTIYRKELINNGQELWGKVDFQVEQIYICHDKMVVLCGSNGQLQFVPWQTEGWNPTFNFVTASKMIRHGLVLKTMKDLFFTVENRSISSYSYMTGGSFTSAFRMDSNIIHAVEQPYTYNAIVALESGEAIGLHMPMQILQLKSLNRWMQTTIATKPFRVACHSNNTNLACLDTSGTITFHNLDNPNSILTSFQARFNPSNIKLLNFFYKGATNIIVAHWKSETATGVSILNQNAANAVTQLEARTPLLAGQLDGNIWLLDSDERWKHYSIA